ncbi:uncharacterized protein LOC120085908 isoform X2 [Benincasa hispida]|uniref:uncharacterized protein LOC120085908 isoform X1 n=1 Tax=Benincasa hispida TaxID=102211 RepID=UPI0019005436|nr:uncharacterized protein LOC120085908 isoform X1 [Benincasa hispida]XP_038898127.1 uncharacterized protein LOC120085908 isoform X2 [Benincasa hispida]XP_038898128.1 uncharacterized protein LOC120085908 isoform X2 [Benincasa hispida]XP_038898129.1 uncharacterized protein LOC120085908 isoform X2 [Benincasa hispida]XP_038898130.1 uncharacterized protein LOC120085908 isoform X2 [Benincasa hispida]XP_038898131.1 uncharacterized protein LOC120085908 isoform X2 [Benincasa hispida]XP_038898132.1 un
MVGISGSSSALDLIKKKLHDSGTPVASSPISASTIAQLDVNLPRDVDVAVKALQIENIKNKPKDANGDGNVSNSSLDSENVKSGPTNEQLNIQFEEDGADPKCSAEVEAEEDEEDFIMEEVKRRLKELRRNSFMVLIPEEEEEEEEEEGEEEGEVGEGDPEWRDVEAEGRQWWGGFGAVYDDYCERMFFFDRMSIRSGPESTSRRSASKKSASPLRCLSLKRIEEPEDEMEDVDPSLTLIDSNYHIETAYVAHICLSWEALHCQYTQLNHLISCQPQNSTTHYNLTAQLFQQFQVLLQRFIENEPFQQGLRPTIYARTRRTFPKMLHVPNIQASDPNGVQEQESDSLILAPDLLLIIEASIFTFHRFLKMEKKTSNSASLSFQNHTQDAALLARVRSSLDKKKTKLKEVRKKSRGWKQKTCPQTYEDMQLLFGIVDIKIISRLVKMSRITKEQLLWCEEKLNKLDISNGKLRRDLSPLLFPC